MNILVLSNIDVGGEWIATQTMIEKLKRKYPHLHFYLISRLKRKTYFVPEVFEETTFIEEKKYSKPFRSYKTIIGEILAARKEITAAVKIKKIDRIISTDYVLSISTLVSFRRVDIFFFHGIKNYYRLGRETMNHFLCFIKILEFIGLFTSKEIILPSLFSLQVLNTHFFGLFSLKKRSYIDNLIRDVFKNKASAREIQELRNKYLIPSKNIIIYVGRINKEKGVNNLFVSFQKLKLIFPSLLLIVAYQTDAQKKIKKFKDSRIIYMKNVQPSELNILYQISLLAVSPSVLEYSSLFLRESIMKNLPIIAVKTGDHRAILSDSFLMRNNKPQTIYDTIKRFLENNINYHKQFKTIRSLFLNRYNERETTKRIYEKLAHE